MNKKYYYNYMLIKLKKEIVSFHGQEEYAFIVERGIVKKKPIFMLFFGLIEKLSNYFIFNMAMLLVVLLFYHAFRLPRNSVDVYEYGISINNLISFERLNFFLFRDSNIEVSINGDKVSFFDRLRAVFPLRRLLSSVRVLTKYRNEKALTQIQLTISLAAFLLYDKHLSNIDIKVICVASDHSPISQAILFWARNQKIKTCYIQHAPVSLIFPPLNYDLSILNDRNSIQVYKEIESIKGYRNKGEVILLPPFKNPFVPPSIGDKPYNFGICLSFFPDLMAIKKVILSLAKNSSVNRIYIRPHPRCTLKLYCLVESDKVFLTDTSLSIERFLDLVDINLVPNSGVAIESLHNGKPTFHMSGVDELKNDYYGFVSARIVPVLDIERLDEINIDISSFFDACWLSRFSSYDYSVMESQEETGNKILDFFNKILQSSRNSSQ